MKLEDLQADASVRGILPDAAVTVVSVQWHGSDALTLVYRGPDGRVADEILYRHDEARLSIQQAVPVREALALINQVLDETLAEQEGDFDADMIGGKATVACRQAMLFYALRTLNFEADGKPRKGERQVVISNLEEIRPFLTRFGQE